MASFIRDMRSIPYKKLLRKLEKEITLARILGDKAVRNYQGQEEYLSLMFTLRQKNITVIKQCNVILIIGKAQQIGEIQN